MGVLVLQRRPFQHRTRVVERAALWNADVRSGTSPVAQRGVTLWNEARCETTHVVERERAVVKRDRVLKRRPPF